MNIGLLELEVDCEIQMYTIWIFHIWNMNVLKKPGWSSKIPNFKKFHSIFSCALIRNKRKSA